MPANDKDAGWEERTSGDFWKPEHEGDSLEGRLVAVRQGNYKGNVYDIEMADGKVKTAPASVFLQNRIKPTDVGKEIRLVFNGLVASKVRGQNPARDIKVFFRG